MAISRSAKEELVSALTEKLKTAKSAVFTDYRGLTVEEFEMIRAKMRDEGAELKVIKNTLFARATKEAGIELTNDAIKGHPVAVAFGNADEVAPARITYDFNKKNDKLTIIGGMLEGKQISDIMVKSLASLPSREELYAKFVGSLNAPLSGMVNVLAGNICGLVNVLNQIKETK